MIELEKHEFLDDKTKKIFESSSKTIDLLRSLGSINAKNREVSSRYKKTKPKNDDDLLQFDEQDIKGFDEAGNSGELLIPPNQAKGERPILGKLANRQNIEENKFDTRSPIEINSNLDKMSKFNLNTKKDENSSI